MKWPTHPAEFHRSWICYDWISTLCDNGRFRQKPPKWEPWATPAFLSVPLVISFRLAINGPCLRYVSTILATASAVVVQSLKSIRNPPV